MAATKMFLIKWYSSSTNLESSGSRLEVVWTSWKSSGLPGSRLDFQEVVWTSRKSSGLPGSRLDFSERFGFSDLEDFWDDLLVSRLEVVWKSSGLPVKSSGSRLNFLKVFWQSLLNFLEVLDDLHFSRQRLVLHLTGLFQKFDFLDDLHFSRLTTYNSVVHETTEIRLKCKSSGEVKLLKLSNDLTFSRLRLQISKSIAKITSALTRRLPGKLSTARRLKGKSSTARRLPNSLAYIRLLQAHRITNESHPPIINQNLGFFSSLWRESERYVVFSSQEWKMKKGKSILGALRASNWLFMVVVVLMTMAIL
ncbi:hypothetical protein IGI04_018413 [Brassica rapa subsp. trilocularis]|uniref:Uncharacterized protein n=1 Tax=Brassica rapa subsp. trilocularis TaxID=1813537 RepID=A0ABQ7MGE2_BRACM|nr:hypothetical protein IGI04_018413 [Brassica rapa subsp. trilocularis]